MILQDLAQNLTQDLKVFFATILKNSYQELIKNLARSSQDLVGIYIHNLGKILFIFLFKYDLTRSCTRSLSRSSIILSIMDLDKILTNC